MTATLIDPERAARVPEVGKPKPIKAPAVAEKTLSSGLRILAARKQGVPRVEARLVIPVARGGDVGKSSVLSLLSKTLLSGTTRRTDTDIAELLQIIGGSLDVAGGDEDVTLFGSALAPALGSLLELMAEVLNDATHPDGEVALQASRLVQEIGYARSQPETVAHEALARRLFGRHPYGRGLPNPDEVARIKPATLRTTQHTTLLPSGSVLVIVGDVRPEKAVAEAEAALEGWKTRGEKPGLKPPAAPKAAPILVVNRAGAVQTNIRIGGPAVDRKHADWPALALANLVFGGYFVSRLVDNIREKRGYTYSPHSGVQHLRRASIFTLQADVGTEVTGPALAEINYELERMVAGPIEAGELQSAKRYLAGTLAMSLQTQAGLASYLAMLATNGLTLDYLRDYPKAVEALTEDEVIAASRKYLAPHKLTYVTVGDASAITPVLEGFGPIEASAG